MISRNQSMVQLGRNTTGNCHWIAETLTFPSSDQIHRSFRNEPDQTDSLLEFHQWCKQICELWFDGRGCNPSSKPRRVVTYQQAKQSVSKSWQMDRSPTPDFFFPPTPDSTAGSDRQGKGRDGGQRGLYGGRKPAGGLSREEGGISETKKLEWSGGEERVASPLMYSPVF